MLVAILMSIGWALRGSIGGGPLGAMIPGALFAMGIARERKWGFTETGLFLGLAALGVGLGGQETYGQTIGLVRDPDTRLWGLLGLTVKGAAWGLLGGLVMSLAWVRPSRPLTLALVLVGATHIGWQWVNHPKWIYFSNRVVAPREELWAGLWLSGLALAAVLRNPVSNRLALYGAIGGGLGFGGGSLWNLVPVAGFPGWKCMEFTLGFVLAFSLRRAIPQTAPASASQPLWAAYPMLAAAIIGLNFYLPLRFAFTATVALALLFLMRYPQLGWPIGFGVTLCAACLDLHPRYTYWAVTFATLPQTLMHFKPLHGPWLLLAICSFIYCLEYLR
jgi:hypothetical protein